MDRIAEHLEHLYDSTESFGIVYFIFMLAEAVDFDMPPLFYVMCADVQAIPFLADTIIDDWFEFDVEDFAK